MVREEWKTTWNGYLEFRPEGGIICSVGTLNSKPQNLLVRSGTEHGSNCSES